MNNTLSKVAIPTLLLLALLAGACRAAGGDRPEEGPPLSWTGVPEVDAVIRAMRVQDVAALAAMARYWEVTCPLELRPTTIREEPLCAALGLPPGATLEVLVLSPAWSQVVPRAAVPAFLRELLARHDYALYGVLKFGPNELLFHYAIFFKGTDTLDVDLSFILSGGQIVAVHNEAGDPARLPPPDEPGWLVPPRPCCSCPPAGPPAPVSSRASSGPCIPHRRPSGSPTGTCWWGPACCCCS